MDNLYFFSGSVTAFFVVLLLTKKNKALYDWLLAAWLAIVLLHILVFYLSIHQPHTYMLEISSAAVFLNGPVLWLYTKNLFGKTGLLEGYHFVHFLPFFLNLVFIVPYIFQNTLAPFPGFVRDLLAWAKLGSILVYSLLAASEIRRNQIVAEDNLSNTEAFHVKWLQLAIYAVIMVWVIGVISQVIFQAGMFGLSSKQEDLAINIAVSIFVIVMGYYGFRQAPIFDGDTGFNGIPGDEKEALGGGEPAVPEIERYKKSAISPGDLKNHAERLEELMLTEKLFTDPELSLNKLAQRLDISTNQLSQVINQHYQKNFYEFVNAFRVEEVIRILHSGALENTTMLGIGLDAGFNSKASFNRYFKKHTGRTPSDYAREHFPAAKEN
jgi:AraC-like DNA-binding protein